MSDQFSPTPFVDLAQWVFAELEAKDRIFDIGRDLWFEPRMDDPFRLELQGITVATPYGVAAGPHTQLASGIIASWLCGARVLELKTVQLRGVEVVRPCIRMRDEGLNVEWSQELEPEASFEQYLDAWVLIHALHRRLGWYGDTPETIFDISVGYDFDGLQSEPMRRYFALVADAGDRLKSRLETLRSIIPSLADLEVPSRLASRVTLSTLHGCPSEDIARMATLLMTEHGLHTKVKLNPSLLGSAGLRQVLHQNLGFTDLEPDDEAFAHDLEMDGAIELIRDLRALAEKVGVTFGVKLSNTLPIKHRGEAFPASEKTMYLSGRPLHPVTVAVADELVRRSESGLQISYCGGADAFNLGDLLSCGFAPVTTCSDILRPGGIPRLRQYADVLRQQMLEQGATSVDDLVLKRAEQNRTPGTKLAGAAQSNLESYAGRTRIAEAYLRGSFHRPGKRGQRDLGPFDCIHAPCISACGIEQDVPEYLRRVANGDPHGAADVIREDNPVPVILGRTCHHPCETECVRTHYDEPVAIRDIKRFAMEHGGAFVPVDSPKIDLRIAVVGGGPCGLGAAWELRRHGAAVSVYEADPEAGGMVTATIPVYRAADDAVQLDLEALKEEGVEFHYGRRFGADLTLDELRAEGYSAVVLAAGAPKGRRLGLPNEDVAGVWDGLTFLRQARQGKAVTIGHKVGVIGAGDVAMDCARTARRLGAEVAVIYRRQAAHSPAHPDEMRALREEGIHFRELLNPLELMVEKDRLVSLRCQSMRPGEVGADGRPRPEAIPGDTEDIELDSVIVAIGQKADSEILEAAGIATRRGGWVQTDPDTGRTSADGVWAGGDVVRGPSSIVAAAGDGRRLARDILRAAGVAPAQKAEAHRRPDQDEVTRLLKLRSSRVKRQPTPELPLAERFGFAEVAGTFSVEAAKAEAGRCVECDLLCSTCVTVCPNRAFFTYEVEPFEVVWPQLQNHSGSLSAVGEVKLSVTQPYQVAVLNDWCNACGNCTEFCPTAGTPHDDKPRLVLDREVFESLDNNAFHARWVDGELELLGRSDGSTHHLRWSSHLAYDGPVFGADLDPDSFAAVKMWSNRGRINQNEVDWSVCLALLTLGKGLLTAQPGMLAACAGRYSGTF